MPLEIPTSVKCWRLRRAVLKNSALETLPRVEEHDASGDSHERKMRETSTRGAEKLRTGDLSACLIEHDASGQQA